MRVDELQLLPDEDFRASESLPGVLPPDAIRTRAEFSELVRCLAECPSERTPEQNSRLDDYIRRRTAAGPHAAAPKRLACIAFTARGECLAQRVAEGLVGMRCSGENECKLGGVDVGPDEVAALGMHGADVDRPPHCENSGSAGHAAPAERWLASVSRGSGPGKEPLGPWTEYHFAHDDALLFVGAAGIAVRAIAPHVRSKASDPAVLVMDEAGTWVVPLLSGHIGGANWLALRIAQLAGAQPVLTTATDVRGMWAVDEWAAQRGLTIANPGAIKAVSAKLLAGGTVRLYSDVTLADELPAHVELVDALRDADVVISPLAFSANRDETPSPLHLIPRVIRVGIGCRRGVSEAQVESAWREALDVLVQRGAGALDERSVAGVYSIDLKAREPGLLSFCTRHGWSLTTYSAGELAAVEGIFTGSDFVRDVTGVDNVCERAAQLGGAWPVIPKQAHDGVTVALARADTTLTFGDPMAVHAGEICEKEGSSL